MTSGGYRPAPPRGGAEPLSTPINRVADTGIASGVHDPPRDGAADTIKFGSVSVSVSFCCNKYANEINMITFWS
jgi:hypothetical protein